MAPFFSREMRPLDLWVALGALAFGIAVFCATPPLIYQVDDDAGILGLLYFMFTPLFGIPLALALRRDGRMGWWGLLYFVGWLTVVHYAATMLANHMYPQPCPLLFEHRHPTPECATFLRQRHWLAMEAGLAAGVLGSAVSYAGLLLFGPAFRTRRALTTMGVSVLLLAAIGAFGLSATVPDEKTAWDYILQLYVPWQTVFGITLLWLFDPSLLTRMAARGRSPAG